MRHAARKDGPQRPIVTALRRIGVVVFVVNQEGLPDLLTYFRGQWLPIEVKRKRRARSLTDPKGRRLTPAQIATYQVAPFPIVETEADALKLFGVG